MQRSRQGNDGAGARASTTSRANHVGQGVCFRSLRQRVLGASSAAETSMRRSSHREASAQTGPPASDVASIILNEGHTSPSPASAASALASSMISM